MASQAEVFIEWVNACEVVSSTIESIHDLSDGLALAQVLNHFLPDSFAPPDASTDGVVRLQSLCDELDTHLGGKLAMIIQADADASAGDQAALVSVILESVVLASVEGPRNQEAVGAIMTLSVAAQTSIMGILQRDMQLDPADAGAAAPKPQVAPAAMASQSSLRMSGKTSSRMSIVDSETGALRSELHEVRARLQTEDMRSQEAERSEKVAYKQLLEARNHAHAIEDEAHGHSLRLATYKKQHGDDMQVKQKDMAELRSELQEAQMMCVNLPKEQERLRNVFDSQKDEAATLRNKVQEMEQEVETAMQVDVHDSDDLKKQLADFTAELTSLTGDVFEVSQSECALRDSANEMLLELRDCEDQTMHRDSEARNYQAMALSQEEQKRDVMGLLDFKEQEMHQVVCGLEKEIGGKKKQGDTVVVKAEDILRVYAELVESGRSQHVLETSKRDIIVRADKMDMVLNRLESQVKDPAILIQTRLMAEELSSSSNFADIQRKKDYEKNRIKQEVSELRKAQATLQGEEGTVQQLRVQLQAEQGMTEQTVEEGRLRLVEAEAKEKAELLAFEEQEREEAAAATAAKEASMQAAASAARQRAVAAAESAAQQDEAAAAASSAAAAAAVAEAEAQAQAKAEAQAQAKVGAEEIAAADEAANKEAIVTLRDDLLLREKMLHNLKKQCDNRRAAIRKEGRLMLAVHHDLAVRYHQLGSHYGALSEDLERRGI